MKKYKIIVSITGKNAKECIAKIDEADNLRLPELALFLERLEVGDREQVYARLERSGIKGIPLVHLRSDMDGSELRMLAAKYRVKYFTIHEDHFNIIENWRGFQKKLFLEMSTDDYVAPNVKVETIGGFCVDLAHYKKQSILVNKDYRYIYERRDKPRLFACNHLSGYSHKLKSDLHLVVSEADFDYLAELPSFVFGNLLAMEIDNPLRDQIRYRDYALAIFERLNKSK